MHAYLFVGTDLENVLISAREHAKGIGEDTYEFPITKIDEVRKLASFVKLYFEKPTTIIVENIGAATEEAMNAFLKNLEESQKNLTYILTAKSEEKLIPTIVSRCQVVRVKGSPKPTTHSKELEGFFDMSVGKKFGYLDKIKKRDEAIDFVQSIIHLWHEALVKEKKDLTVASQSLSLAEKTHKSLQANGNVNLQLANFAIALSHL